MGTTRLNTLKRKLYDNCIVRNRRGDLIFYSSIKRAKWYVDRNLATVLSEDPLEIQLNFETKGNGSLGDEFYLQLRKNICVVCGSEDGLTRHHVCPAAFRDHMPEEIKTHSYHDIVLLCANHHEEYENHATELKRVIANEFNLPIDGEWLISKEDHINKHKSVSIARTLLEHYDKIPEERRNFLLNKIKENMGVDEVDLKAVADMKFPRRPRIVKTLGELVVEQLDLTNLNSFLYRWRAHFIEVMRPAYLPEFWSLTRDKR